MIASEDKTCLLNIWFGRLSLNTADLSSYWNLLDAAEHRRALSMKNPFRQQCYVEAHGRLRTLLGEAVDAAPEDLKIALTEHGKPYLADYPSVAFNLSHTADHVAIVVGNQCRVGIDIESCKPRSNLSALVDKCFAAAEADYWRELPADRQLPAFYHFWTRKEAFVKAVGRGITLGLQHCVIDPANPDRMLGVPLSCGMARDWSLYKVASDDDICGSVAVDKPIREISVKAFAGR